MEEALTDEELMSAVRGGAVDRLAELFRRHASLLHAFFRRRTRDVRHCEDLVQETFLRVLKYRRSWRGEGTFSGWLFRLAANLHRDQRASGTTELPDDDAAALIDRAPPPQSLERAEASARLFAALARLDGESRAIVEMRWFEELAAEEIGLRLGCTAGAARVRLHRAHARLLALYSGQE